MMGWLRSVTLMLFRSVAGVGVLSILWYRYIPAASKSRRLDATWLHDTIGMTMGS